VAAQEVQPPFPPPPGSRFFGAPVGAVPPAAAKHDGISNLEESPELAQFTPEERVHIWVYELCNRSVVHITTKSIREGALLLFAVEIPAEGEGSGVVLDRNGHILTNCHVVEDAQEIQVTLFNGKSYAGRLVGQDRVTDVAVLRIEAPPEELFPVVFGDSNRLRVGQRVYAIGNPFGFERTLTTGIISSLNRTLPSRSRARTIKNVIQIDAAINPGNSGGPLLDTRGRMIGMNTAIASRTGESAGVGFAIPVNTIARVVPQLIEHGRVRRPDVGILRVYQTERGLLVAALTPGGPAEKAGIRGPQVIRQRRRQGPLVYEYTTIDRSAADLIVGVDGQKIKNADDFLSLIESKQPGDVVTLNVLRQGRLVDVPVRLEAGE
jgi:S1-C subfamily serine protease